MIDKPLENPEDYNLEPQSFRDFIDGLSIDDIEQDSLAEAAESFEDWVGFNGIVFQEKDLSEIFVEFLVDQSKHWFSHLQDDVVFWGDNFESNQGDKEIKIDFENDEKNKDKDFHSGVEEFIVKVNLENEKLFIIYNEFVELMLNQGISSSGVSNTTKCLYYYAKDWTSKFFDNSFYYMNGEEFILPQKFFQEILSFSYREKVYSLREIVDALMAEYNVDSQGAELNEIDIQNELEEIFRSFFEDILKIWDYYFEDPDAGDWSDLEV